MRTPLFALGMLVALPLLGCSSSDATDSQPAAPQTCVGPGFPNDPAEVDLSRVTATLVQPDGSPAANVNIQVCGVNQCLYGASTPLGKVSVPVTQPLVQPAFKYGNGYELVELAVQITDPAAQSLGQMVAIPLPDFADGAVFPKSSGSVSNGDVTLKIAAGTTIGFDELTYLDPNERTFRSAAIPLESSQQALPADFGFELAYGLAPIATRLCPAAQLSLLNTPEWSAGTELEVFVQGLEPGTLTDGPEWAPYGSWTKVAEAVVSKDGSSIDTTSGGIPILSSVALRRK